MRVPLPAVTCSWRAFAVACGLLAVLPLSVASAATIDLNAGYLRPVGGTGTLTAATTSTSTAGSLLLLVAVGNSNTTFDNTLTLGSYVAGGDVILAAAAFNNFGGSTSGQTTTNALTFTTPSTTSVGNAVELLWFPTITLAQYDAGTTPGVGTTFGAYNPSFYATNTTTTPDGGSPFVVPSAAATVTLNFFTTDNDAITGTQAPIEGDADLLTAVPEPSTVVGGLVGGIAALAAWGSRKRRVLAG